MSEAEQCQPFGAVAELPIVMTVDPVVRVDVVNFPAVAPPTKVPSSSPPLEVKVVPVEMYEAAFSVPVLFPLVEVPKQNTFEAQRDMKVSL